MNLSCLHKSDLELLANKFGLTESCTANSVLQTDVQKKWTHSTALKRQGELWIPLSTNKPHRVAKRRKVPSVAILTGNATTGWKLCSKGALSCSLVLRQPRSRTAGDWALCLSLQGRLSSVERFDALFTFSKYLPKSCSQHTEALVPFRTDYMSEYPDSLEVQPPFYAMCLLG